MLGRAVNELDRERPYVIVLLTYCGVCGVLRFAFAHSLAHLSCPCDSPRLKTRTIVCLNFSDGRMRHVTCIKH